MTIKCLKLLNRFLGKTKTFQYLLNAYLKQKCRELTDTLMVINR